jgi:DNA-binding response OmpR family regulator
MEILIVDVDTEVIENLLSALNKYKSDWHISVIDSGKQCLEIVRNSNRSDILILGSQLSDMSGFELTEQIRDDSDMPILLLSRDKDMQMLIKAFNAGANDYMTIPFNNQIFIARLKALIRRRNWDIQARRRAKTG